MLDQLLFKVYTQNGYWYTYDYKKALDYYEKENGIMLMGYTTDLFPKWYVLKERKHKSD